MIIQLGPSEEQGEGGTPETSDEGKKIRSPRRNTGVAEAEKRQEGREKSSGGGSGEKKP